MLLAPAAVVFVATRTTVDPLTKTERIDVSVPHALGLPEAVPGVVFSDITPPKSGHITVHVRRRVPHVVHPRAVVRAKPVVRAPNPVYVVKPAVTHVAVTARVAPHPKVAASTPPQPTPTPSPSAT